MQLTPSSCSSRSAGPAVLPGLDQLGDQIRVIDNGVRREAGDDRPLPDGRDLRPPAGRIKCFCPPPCSTSGCAAPQTTPCAPCCRPYSLCRGTRPRRRRARPDGWPRALSPPDAPDMAAPATRYSCRPPRGCPPQTGASSAGICRIRCLFAHTRRATSAASSRCVVLVCSPTAADRSLSAMPRGALDSASTISNSRSIDCTANALSPCSLPSPIFPGAKIRSAPHSYNFTITPRVRLRQCAFPA